MQNFFIHSNSNIGTQHFVNTEKFTVEIADLRKRCKNVSPWCPPSDVMILAYRNHEY